jgi:hypothetical protein
MKLITLLLLLSQSDGTEQAAESVPETADPVVCGLNQHARDLALLIMEHPSQQRSQLTCHEGLVQMAEQRAKALLDGTADEGLTPNQVLRDGGYRFATFYPPTGNQVEAVAKNQASPEAAMSYLAEGNQHHDHVLGYGEFFSRQHEMGVGYYENELGKSQYVVFIAEPYSSPKIVYKQSFKTPKMVTRTRCDKNWRYSKNEQMKKICREMEKEGRKQP